LADLLFFKYLGKHISGKKLGEATAGETTKVFVATPKT
jgi:hypothetical protein